MTDETTSIEDRARALDQFATAAEPRGLPAAQPGGAVQGFGHQPTGVIAVAVHRDVHRVLNTIKALASAAGEDWYYRFPVRDKRRGTTSFIEGPSIKLANDLARTYGNCEVDTRVMDLGKEWLIYARFTDLETGFSLTRPFQQSKNASRLGGDDDARRLDIALQIGVSKAIRNVVVNALQTFADEAFDAAKSSLVERIGRDLESYRQRTIGRLEDKVDVRRVEHVIGRAAKDWLAPDIARVIAMMKAVSDGLATLDETFPPLPAEGEAKPMEAEDKRESVEDFAQGESTEAKRAKGDAVKGKARAEKPAEEAPRAEPGQQDDPDAQATAEQPAEPRSGAEQADPGDGPGEDGTDAHAEARAAGAKARRQGRARGAIPEAYQSDEGLTAAWFEGWDNEKPRK